MAAVDPFSRFVLPTTHTSSLSYGKFSVSTFLPVTGPTWIVDNIATLEIVCLGVVGILVLVTTPVNVILRGHHTTLESAIEQIRSRERNQSVVYGIFRFRRIMLSISLCTTRSAHPVTFVVF